MGTNSPLMALEVLEIIKDVLYVQPEGMGITVCVIVTKDNYRFCGVAYMAEGSSDEDGKQVAFDKACDDLFKCEHYRKTVS